LVEKACRERPTFGVSSVKLPRQYELTGKGESTVVNYSRCLSQMALHFGCCPSELYKVAWSVIKGFGENPDFLGAKAAMIAILHTWGQNLSLHPHLHCIVPAGGVKENGRWKHAPKGNDFLYPVKEMSTVFRAQFVAELRKNGRKIKKKNRFLKPNEPNEMMLF
jgi:hypothetical protein